VATCGFIDPAATGVTAAVWAAISPRNDVYLYRLYYERDLIVSDHPEYPDGEMLATRLTLGLLIRSGAQHRNAETHKQGYQLYREMVVRSA